MKEKESMNLDMESKGTESLHLQGDQIERDIVRERQRERNRIKENVNLDMESKGTDPLVHQYCVDAQAPDVLAQHPDIYNSELVCIINIQSKATLW